MSLSAIVGFLGGLVSPISEAVKGWQERKRVKLEGEIALAQAVTQAKIQRLQTTQEADIAWENTALNQTGFKDEVMMFVILAPMVMCFIPGGADYVAAGFTAINTTVPVWWQSAFGATVAVSYGLKKFADFKSFAKGA